MNTGILFIFTEYARINDLEDLLANRKLDAEQCGKFSFFFAVDTVRTTPLEKISQDLRRNNVEFLTKICQDRAVSTLIRIKILN